MTFIESKSRYWIEARAGFKDIELYCQHNRNTMAMGKNESLYSMVYRWREEICPTIVLELFYRYQLSKNISITPGVYWVFNPEGASANPTATVGLIRTTFSF